MTTSNRKKGLPRSASQNKKENVRLPSEEELLSPEILPIYDHWKEKRLIELNNTDYMFYLWVGKLEKKREGTLSEEALHDRIREVYRLCFQSEKKENMNVINDFVTFQPNLVFNTPWLAFLVKRHTIFGRPGDNSERKRLLKALGDGFQRAADSKLLTNRWVRSIKLIEGKALVEKFKDELRTFYGSVDWVHAIKEEVVPEKVEELIKRHACLAEYREKLSEHLLRKRVSAAAQLIVNKVLGVRLHDLKSKTKE